MENNLEPVCSGAYIPPVPLPTKRVFKFFRSYPLINQLNVYFWKILASREYNPEEFKPWAPDRRRASRNGVTITPILIEFVEDATTVFSMPTAIILDLLGVPEVAFRTAQRKYRANKADLNRAALTAAMSRDPEIFEASVAMMRSSKGRLNLANAKLEELNHQRQQDYQDVGTIDELFGGGPVDTTETEEE